MNPVLGNRLQGMFPPPNLSGISVHPQRSVKEAVQTDFRAQLDRSMKTMTYMPLTNLFDLWDS